MSTRKTPIACGGAPETEWMPLSTRPSQNSDGRCSNLLEVGSARERQSEGSATTPFGQSSSSPVGARATASTVAKLPIASPTHAPLHAKTGGGGGPDSGPAPSQKAPPAQVKVKLVLTVKEACYLAGISRGLMYRLWSIGAGPERIKILGRTGIRREALERWLIESTVTATKRRQP